jgi:hypothetical protein
VIAPLLSPCRHEPQRRPALGGSGAEAKGEEKAKNDEMAVKDEGASLATAAARLRGCAAARLPMRTGSIPTLDNPLIEKVRDRSKDDRHGLAAKGGRNRAGLSLLLCDCASYERGSEAPGRSIVSRPLRSSLGAPACGLDRGGNPWELER